VSFKRGSKRLEKRRCLRHKDSGELLGLFVSGGRERSKPTGEPLGLSKPWKSIVASDKNKRAGGFVARHRKAQLSATQHGFDFQGKGSRRRSESINEVRIACLLRSVASDKGCYSTAGGKREEIVRDQEPHLKGKGE